MVSCHFHDGDRGDHQVGRLFLEYCMVIFDGVACRRGRCHASLARRQMKNMLQTESANFHLFFFASVPECIRSYYDYTVSGIVLRCTKSPFYFKVSGVFSS
jgi:hypothetical protein